MKKVLVALAMVLGTGSSVVFAQEVNNHQQLWQKPSAAR